MLSNRTAFNIQKSEISRLDFIEQPWGDTIAQPVGKNSIGLYIGIICVLIGFAYSLYALAIHYYRNRSGTALAMLLSIGLFLVFAIEGIMVRVGLINLVHLGPFGMLAMIFTMSLALSHEMQQKLQASEHRFRSLVEQSPFSIQVLSRDGHTLQVNKAWESLWGVSLAQISDYNLLQDQQLRDKGVMPYLEQGFNGKATEIPPIIYNPAENDSPKGPDRNRWVRAFVYPVKDEADQVREVVLLHEDVTEKKQFDDAINVITSEVSAKTGNDFFNQLVTSLANLFGMQYAFIGVLELPDSKQIKTMALYANGQLAPNLCYGLVDTPCATVVGHHSCVYPRDVQQLFPKDQLLVEMDAQGYIGAPLFNPKGEPLGILVLIDKRPLGDVKHIEAIMEIVAVRTAAEIERNIADDLLLQQKSHLQEMVEQRTTELELANKELEAFSYSVSHDLRAPLRAIDGFSEALTEDCAKQLDDQGLDYLSRIRGAAMKMANIIESLLQLSHSMRNDIDQQPINLSELVLDSVKKNQELYPSHNVKLHVIENIMVCGDIKLLSIAVDNLISNAWKYTTKTTQPAVEFGQENQANKPVYFIRDNGAGFDMENADKLFNAFQRMHTSKEFEGTGIGLTTAARIIKRHGGEIWADAKPNHGATFYFTLPGSI